MTYFVGLSVLVYVLHKSGILTKDLDVPFQAVATLSTALAIYLGFKNNSAYDRWWEARKIWGLLVNDSRAFAREVLTLPFAERQERDALQVWKRTMVYRHMAFVHGLRVFIRRPNGLNEQRGRELINRENSYQDLTEFLSSEEFTTTESKRNPPNHLLLRQSEELEQAYERGWLTDFRYVELQRLLTEFNHHQGKAERIKNTPLPRPYSFYSRIFVYIHGTLVPFAFVEELGWANVPLSILINFVFMSLDQIGERTEDPFENRPGDVPLTTIAVTIEENLKEMLGEVNLPEKPKPELGIAF